MDRQQLCVGAGLLSMGILGSACARGPEPSADPTAGVGELWFHREPWRAVPEAEEAALEPVLVPERAALFAEEQKGAPAAERLAQSSAASAPAEVAPAGVKEAPRPAAEQAARPASAPPGPVPPAEWKVLPFLPGPSSDTITLRKGQADFQLRDTLVQASARTALIAYQGDGPFDRMQLSNCLFRVEPGTLPKDRSYWGLRGYDMRDTRLAGVEITGFGRPTDEHDEGHAIYFNLAGSLTLEDCYIHHNGGQGSQLVNRPGESRLPRGPAAGTILVERTWYHENGFNPDRGGFQLSIFGTGQDVFLKDVEIVAGRDGTAFPDGKTGGALLIEAEGFHDNADTCWWSDQAPGKPADPAEAAQAEAPAEPEIPFTNGLVHLENVLIDHVNPNRAIAQIKGCSELVVRGSTFVSGQVNLDDPTKPGRNSGRIEWSGNQGDAEVFLRGERIGTASEDFVAVDGVRQ